MLYRGKLCTSSYDRMNINWKDEQINIWRSDKHLNIKKTSNVNRKTSNEQINIRWISVRAKSRLCDTVTQTWYYQVCVILCITHTWYLNSGKFLTLKKMSVRCAFFRTLLIHTFLQQCVILKIVFFLKNQSITSAWYYHVCVIL